MAIFRFFLSLKTVFGLFALFIIILLIGSLSLPNNLAFFSGIDDSPLFRWLAGSDAWQITWWIYALIALLGIFAISTVFCTIEALIKPLNRKQLAVKLSPQIMHIGVLFIMLGHLLTASFGFKTDILLKQGEKKIIEGGAGLVLKDVSIWKDQNGYDSDWEATLAWTEGGRRQEASLKPASPRYIGLFGLYSKAVSVDPAKTALIRVSRDPGAAWALLGGLLLSAGGIGFLYGRFRKA